MLVSRKSLKFSGGGVGGRVEAKRSRGSICDVSSKRGTN